MCGRFSLGVDTDRLVAEFGLPAGPPGHVPRFNIAPTQPVAVVLRAPEGLRAGWLRWGLGATPGGRVRAPLINARSETVHRLPSFAGAFRRRRCWILADGFYEWKREEDGSRSPYHIRLPDGRPFALAGVWNRMEGKDGPVAACAILTTRPAPVMRGIHDRMPVILPAATRDAWLDPGADPEALRALLQPAGELLEAVRVSTRVNDVAHDDPSCRIPAPPAS